MAREKKVVQEDPPEGAPEWMVTFSDCMTLLLTFFVLLLSFSSFDDQNEAKYRKMTDSFAQNLSFNDQKTKEEESVVIIQNIDRNQKRYKGSEQPTREEGQKNNLKKETEPRNFRDQKIFLVSSDKIFWGKGTRISLTGQELLGGMAEYLKKMRNRIVITECNQGSTTDASDLGLRRAWAIVEYLTSEQGMDRALFSISASSTVAKGALPPEEAQADRMLEIVLLERRIYN